jgi:hypothetical protein
MTIRISFSDKTVRVAVEVNGSIESAITELPQRTWVGLTDEQIDKLWVQHIPAGMNGTEWRRRFVRSIEAAHGIKENT